MICPSCGLWDERPEPASKPLPIERQPAASRECPKDCSLECCKLPHMVALVYQKTIVGECECKQVYPKAEPLTLVRQRALGNCIGDCSIACGNGCDGRPP